MADQGILNALANPVNSVQQGYQQVNSQIMAAQNLHDNNMLKVFEFAGDGQVDAAKAFAQAKGINIPPEVLSNADMAQGLFISGKMYPNDPNAAFKFNQAWMTNQSLPERQRTLLSAQQAGAPIDPEERKYVAMGNMFKFKAANTPPVQHGISPGQARFNAGQKASDAITIGKGAGADVGEAAAARDEAYKQWDANNPNAKSSPGLTYTDDNQNPAGDFNLDTGEPNLNQMQQNQGGGGYALPPSVPAQAAPAPAASAAQPSLPSGLPPGSVMMGTSGGKAYYQDPAGNQYQ